MALADVAFEVEASGTLGAFTRAHPDARALVRVTALDAGEAQLLVTVAGGAGADAVGLLRALREELGGAGSPQGFEVLSVTPYSVVVRASAVPLRVPWLEPAARFLEVFGRDTLLEPAVVERGLLRVRGIAVQPMDTLGAVERLQELQRQGGWKGFRVLRVGTFDPRAFGAMASDLLDADQEGLLRLAVAMGYYATPRRCNLEGIAERLDLSVSPVHKRLKEAEHTLIEAHVVPGARPARKARRAGRRSPAPAVGLLREVVVRIAGPGFAPAAFTAEHPGTRVVYQPLPDRPGFASALFVVVGPPEHAAAFQQFLGRVEVTEREVLSRDAAHLGLRVRQRVKPGSAAGEGSGLGKDPLPALAAALGRDTYLKPAVCEGGSLEARAVVVRRLGEEDLAAALEELATEEGWGPTTLLRVRDVALEGELAALPRPVKMTERQEEVLRVAHALGYYRTPRACTLEDVAATLGVSANAVHKSLAAAEQRIIENYVLSAV